MLMGRSVRKEEANYCTQRYGLVGKLAVPIDGHTRPHMKTVGRKSPGVPNFPA